MATPPLETSPTTARAHRLRVLVDRDSLGALVLSASIPFLFLHERFQPDLRVGVSSTTVDLRPSDAAIVAVVVMAAVSAVRLGIPQLRAALAVWLPGAALLAWLAFEALRPVSLHDDAFATHLVSALKLGEYALVAVAVPLLVRRPRDLTIVTGAIVLWSTVATGVAVLQLLGLDIFEASTAGWRYPSFLGRHDLAALSSLAASLAAAGVVSERRRAPAPRLFGTACVAGVLGLVLAGSITAAGGFAVGAVALALAARARFSPSLRRLVALAAVVLVVGGGVVVVRSAALQDFLDFVGIGHHEAAQGVESYSQRTVLAYIGLRIFEDNPVVGVGWQRSSEPEVFDPYLAAAHRRFPNVVDLAFPSREHPWGVQNLYVQLLADAGVVGLVLLLALGAGGLMLGWRTAAYASHPWAAGAGLAVLCALITLAGEWSSLGIVPGIPLQAATSLVLGLAAAGAATVEDESSG